MFLWNWMYGSVGTFIMEFFFNVMPVCFVFFLVEAIRGAVSRKRYWPWAVGAGLSLAWIMGTMVRYLL